MLKEFERIRKWREKIMKNKNKRPICTSEYVGTNRIDQFLFHLGTKIDNPVMLFWHGGPGSSESLLRKQCPSNLLLHHQLTRVSFYLS
ncbi:hypothetical protein [Clostridium muellerianum]|uniref:hypothetical protein n=1 Tax=Clostridium muellerianum TaxID=2716538 RepID=UPI001FAC6627|nr:hypothetical protein [Clostridium muellerianum]